METAGETATRPLLAPVRRPTGIRSEGGAVVDPTGIQRPNWSVLDDMVGDLRKAMREAEQTQRRMLSVTGTAWSEDRLIKATVGPRGHLIELDIDPRIYRKPNSVALAASIVDTVRVATEEVIAKTQKILADTIPSDMRAGSIGKLDVNGLLSTTDAELLKEDDE
jgi:DNA-binding protein YbaB